MAKVEEEVVATQEEAIVEGAEKAVAGVVDAGTIRAAKVVEVLKEKDSGEH